MKVKGLSGRTKLDFNSRLTGNLKYFIVILGLITKDKSGVFRTKFSITCLQEDLISQRVVPHGGQTL